MIGLFIISFTLILAADWSIAVGYWIVFHCFSLVVNVRMGIRAVPFKSVGGRRNGRFFEGGEGPNSELIFPIRLHLISGRRGGVPNF